MAGYSGTPPAKKLGIAAGSTGAAIDDPGHFDELVAPLPEGVRVRSSARGKAEVVGCFVPSRRALERRVDSPGRMVFPAGAAWVAWAKRASGVVTDVTGDVVRAVALPLGLVDVEVAAIDTTWSGLKLVWRRSMR